MGFINFLSSLPAITVVLGAIVAAIWLWLNTWPLVHVIFVVGVVAAPAIIFLFRRARARAVAQEKEISLRAAGLRDRQRHQENLRKIEIESAKAAERERQVKKAIQVRIKEHGATLSRKRKQFVYKNDYGSEVTRRWHSECDDFIADVLEKSFPEFLSELDEPSPRNPIDREWLYAAIDEVALSAPPARDTVDRVTPEKMTPAEFEQYCAELLREAGWEARITPGSGDQGVDIIAKRGKVRAVFQCKLHAKPVGNSAVQEVIAGRQYENADLAAVVSNGTFTKSARQLAAAASVHLLHVDDLLDFASRRDMEKGGAD